MVESHYIKSRNLSLGNLMIKKIVITLLAAFALTTVEAHNHHPTLIINMDNVDQLPSAFRTIPELNISGSAQFSENGLKAVLKKINSKNITIVDLREESHGYLNGKAVSWYADKNRGNAGKCLDCIFADENEKLSNAFNQNITLVWHKTLIPMPIIVHEVSNERDLSLHNGVKYVRIPVTDHCRPSDEKVDELIQMVQTLPEGTWLHFHCQAGKGRTTTFMSLVEMMKNAQTKTLEEIIARQSDIGGAALLTPHDETVWKFPYTSERIKFIKEFYRYCREVPNFDITWKDWKTNNYLLHQS